MTKKEYCLTNEPVACHDYYRMQIHGIEYGIEDYVYLSRLYQKTVCGITTVMFHKVKVYTDNNGDSYIKVTERLFNGKKHTLYLSLDSFIKCDSPWGYSGISCESLKAFC